MKLKIPAELEKAERKEKLSPTTGHPRVPGILSIALGALLFCSKKAEKTKTKTIAMIVNISVYLGSVRYTCYVLVISTISWAYMLPCVE